MISEKVGSALQIIREMGIEELKETNNRLLSVWSDKNRDLAVAKSLEFATGDVVEFDKNKTSGIVYAGTIKTKNAKTATVENIGGLPMQTYTVPWMQLRKAA